MKVSRADLKAIVKECLVEILSEGVGSALVETKRPVERPRVVEKKRTSDPALDTPVGKRTQTAPKFNTGNSVFDDILADTAKNTLPEMLAAENSRPSIGAVGTVERIVESSTPEQLFGDEAASKWAELAFSTVQHKS